MKEIAGQRRRFGCRRIGILLERKGMIMNHKKLYRLYREEGLSVKRRRGRKRARGSRTPMPEAAHPNARWSLDFLADSFGASRKFRILAVIDDCCRENLCLTADTSISGARVARELDALMRIYGKPACIVSELPLERHWSERQWRRRRVHQPRHPEVRRQERGALALHRPGQAPAECLHRELQRQPARRALERGDLRHLGRRPAQTVDLHRFRSGLLRAMLS